MGWECPHSFANLTILRLPLHLGIEMRENREPTKSEGGGTTGSETGGRDGAEESVGPSTVAANCHQLGLDSNRVRGYAFATSEVPELGKEGSGR